MGDLPDDSRALMERILNDPEARCVFERLVPSELTESCGATD